MRPEHLAPVLAAAQLQISPDERERIGAFFG